MHDILFALLLAIYLYMAQYLSQYASEMSVSTFLMLEQEVVVSLSFLVAKKLLIGLWFAEVYSNILVIMLLIG